MLRMQLHSTQLRIRMPLPDLQRVPNLELYSRPKMILRASYMLGRIVGMQVQIILCKDEVI